MKKSKTFFIKCEEIFIAMSFLSDIYINTVTSNSKKKETSNMAKISNIFTSTYHQRFILILISNRLYKNPIFRSDTSFQDTWGENFLTFDVQNIPDEESYNLSINYKR